jgi:acyl-CoA reductase-like NAD-dependent aldehyde dehydrogenase
MILAVAEAHLGEIMTTLEKIRYLINHGEDAIKPSHRRVPMAFMHRTARVDYLPLGVIGAIIPWNYPAHSCFSPTVAALFTGNACVIKVSEYSSYSRAYLQAICQTVLEKRGHSRDLVQFLPGHGDTGAALCKCPDIGKILFIGSPQTGKRVMEACVTNLTPVILELGGKDPFVITDDAELSWAASVAIRGSFINCGQNCIASERIFVHKKVYEEFVKTVVSTMKSTIQGENACDWGCMTMELQLTKVEDLVNDAIAKGAKLLHGGKRNTALNKSGGLFFEPTILTNINDSMRILHEETFGPVMLINVWEDEADLIARINKCEFGLGASVFSKNQARAERIISQIESGMGVVNDFGLPYLLQDAPFGGCKQSGFGRFNGPEGLREFCRAQSVLGEVCWTPTAIKGPRLVSYPMLPVTPYAVQHMTTMFYGWGLSTKIGAVLSLLKVLITGPPKDKTQ